jgi:hypothetical protein
VQLDTGEIYHVEANWIHNNELDHWHGWSCDAGYKRINIDAEFNATAEQYRFLASRNFNQDDVKKNLPLQHL